MKRNDLGLGCRVGPVYSEAFRYADDVALHTPSIYCLIQMIEVCESFEKLHVIVLNPIKLKLLCFKCYTLNVPIFLNGCKDMPVVSHGRDVVTLFQQIFWIGT